MSIFLLKCIEVSKEKRIFISLILFRCTKRFILSQKTKNPEKMRQSFRLSRESITICRIPFSPNGGFRQPEKRKNNISQMRLGSVFKMRTSIINTATTEQMGWIIFSFFVYTKSTNQSLADKDMLLLPDSIQNTSPDVIFYTLFAYRAIR